MTPDDQALQRDTISLKCVAVIVIVVLTSDEWIKGNLLQLCPETDKGEA